MITGHIERLDELDNYPKAVVEALNFLRNTDLVNIESGVYEIHGKDMFVQILDLFTGDSQTKNPEIHREYIDLQYLVKGNERIGFSIDRGNNKVLIPYNSERDILFYENCENESFLNLIPGNFAVFFPSVVHRPACNPSTGEVTSIRKVVIKIHTKLLNK